MPKTTEVPKRLTPLGTTLRTLYLLSGNQCAWESCTHAVIDSDGQYVAELCHIEAAEPAGERFNENMSNEDRRQAANLVLMCHRHHVKTDNVDKYPVEAMREIKRKHEDKYSEGIDSMLSEITDHTLANVIVPPVTLGALYAHEGIVFDVEDHDGNVAAVLDLGRRLLLLSLPARQTLEIVVRRGGVAPGGGDLVLLVSEVIDVTGESVEKVYDRIGQLVHRGLASLPTEDDDWYGLPGRVVVAPDLGNWPTWLDLRDFATATGRSLANLIVDLDFTVLD